MIKGNFTKIIMYAGIWVAAIGALLHPGSVKEIWADSAKQREQSAKLGIHSADLRYVDYYNSYAEAGFHGEEITILGTDFLEGSGVSREVRFQGKSAVTTDEQGYVTWEAKIEKSGLYGIEIEYYPMEGTGGRMERTLWIDGEIPFLEAFGVEFTRIYKDHEESPSGKIARPDQIEAPRWVRTYINDSFGYFGEALYFYMEKGTHTITLHSVKEPMAISQIRLVSQDLTPSPYGQVLREYNSQGVEIVQGALEAGILFVQAENAFEKGDPTLYAVNDATSTKNQPFDYKEKVMNAMGGIPWKHSNQWVSWNVYIPKSGLYHIGIRSKQNFVRDIDCNRTLYIDEQIPFTEAANILFPYNDKWKTGLIGGETPYLFYLEEGEHTIKLQVTAGDLEEVLTEADYILTSLNRINLSLVALMGTTPDVDRDYQMERYMPETLQELEENAKRLQKIHRSLMEKTGKRDSLTSELEQLITLVQNMTEKPEQIPALFSRFRDRVGSFGTWMMKVREHPLLLDYLFIAEAGADIPKQEDHFFNRIYAGLVAFIHSFTTDYSMLSKDMPTEEAITVWIGSGLTGGRDQALALNRMVQQSFTAQTGIPVNLQLVPESTILMATLAGRGPDVALQVKISDPVDFALRNAVEDLTQFADYGEIADRFFESAITPFMLEEGVYALPETMSFPMLFYRTDILYDLGIDSDRLKTWKDIVKILPILQGRNMNFALPQTMQSYSMFLYQRNGSYYTEGGRASNLNTKTSLEAFQHWTDFYTVYSLPIDFSFENRFRTGEMPIGISEYTTYNLLSISAPEIKGKWRMTQLPGIADGEGNINNTSPATSLGCVLMKGSSSKEAAWEFMKWWTKAESQYEFGKQLEAVMGAAARYNTANVEALQKLPWSAADRIGLMNQAENIRGMPQVPGGYFTERNLNFAKLAVLNDKADPRETLSNYSANITEEIAYKRKEFRLDIEE